MANKQQLTGNIGLFLTCAELSKHGWVAMPTVRNARGADIYAHWIDDEDQHIAIQVKSLSKRVSPVPLGKDLNSLRSHWWVIVTEVHSDAPEFFLFTLDEVKKLAFASDPSKMKDGKPAYWLQQKSYQKDEFRGRWGRIH